MTIDIKGRLDTSSAPELEQVLDEKLDGAESLIFDMTDIDYISSAGLRVLLSAQKKMNKKGGMIVKNANEVVMEVFEVIGFVDILNIQ